MLSAIDERIIARTERMETSETEAGEGTLVDVQVPLVVEETAEVSHEWEQINKNKPSGWESWWM